MNLDNLQFVDQTTKSLVEGFIKEMNSNEIYHLFDGVSREIFKLLKGSFMRFEQSEEYSRLIEISVDKSDGHAR